jgi:hypothetical protein
VTNEQHELAQRHRTFNVRELAQHAARVVKADRCLSIKKYPDGMYNRVLLLSMDNEKEVVAKIPNPNSGQPHFTTTSEVATMKFVSPPSWLHKHALIYDRLAKCFAHHCLKCMLRAQERRRLSLVPSSF